MATQQEFGEAGLAIAEALFAAWGQFRADGNRDALLKLWPALSTPTTVPGVEPTNNHAERGLRGAVIYRKLSLGSQSEHGERTIERLLSASVTCRLQGRSLFAYLTDVLSASIRGDPIPALA